MVEVTILIEKDEIPRSGTSKHGFLAPSQYSATPLKAFH
jgi:hypothetical protein